ncbi:MAG: HAMP domain-containing sensor histidine kinase [Elusimicrobiota bacterium]
MDRAQQELLRRAASVIGHDLRNPMAIINNSVYFVRAKLPADGVDPKVEKHLKIIESEIARADRLLTDMLTFSRPYLPAAETKDFDPFIESRVKEYPLPEGGKIDFKPEAKGARSRFDPAALGDALRRLLDNAFFAMGDKGTVKVSTHSVKDTVVACVADSGPGVDAKIKDDLYEAFMTTKPKGLGLGLSLARKYLEGNGGSITHETGPKGASFRLILPAI